MDNSTYSDSVAASASAMPNLLETGKQRVQEKLNTIDNLKSRLLQYLTNGPAQPTEAALQLLQETDRGRFFAKIASVNEDLEKYLNSLLLLCVSINNDDGEPPKHERMNIFDFMAANHPPPENKKPKQDHPKHLDTDRNFHDIMDKGRPPPPYYKHH
ncbi:uncharacterized protein LOC144868193 [Branchiostoma floridae x Branchiostoma japonicum]